MGSLPRRSRSRRRTSRGCLQCLEDRTDPDFARDERCGLEFALPWRHRRLDDARRDGVDADTAGGKGCLRLGAVISGSRASWGNVHHGLDEELSLVGVRGAMAQRTKAAASNFHRRDQCARVTLAPESWRSCEVWCPRAAYRCAPGALRITRRGSTRAFHGCDRPPAARS
jgi:hypothetical protein